MEIPYEVSSRRDTGLYNAKIGIWLFLASEVMLFGGLFSAYVFLRVGVDPSQGDIPWPIGVQKVWIGFTNTLVLIASSVFVVFSWLALKERNWRKFQYWMAAVIACALTFMVLKTIEYKSKFAHQGIILKDGSVLEGKIKDKSDRIEFEADKVSFNLGSAVPGFAGQVYEKSVDENGETHFKRISINDLELRGPVGKTSDTLVTDKIPNFKRWFHRQHSRVNRELAADRKARRNGEEPPLKDGVVATAEIFAVTVETKTEGEGDEAKEVVVETPTTILFMANPRSLQGHTEKTLSFKDAVTAEGTLKNDVVSFEIHELDLQMVPYEEQEDAQAWTYIEEVKGGHEQKEHWFAARDEAFAPIKKWYEDRDRTVPRKQSQSRIVSLQEIHLGHHGDGHGEKEGHQEDHHEEKAADPGDAGSESEADSYLHIPRDQIKLMASHGPRYHPYYAIYFTLTGLHGLHVIGGALVLTYMLVFGKKLFLRNPEHMANRVEVGGLFWHFVDLVWIFLFPIMYLF